MYNEITIDLSKDGGNVLFGNSKTCLKMAVMFNLIMPKLDQRWRYKFQRCLKMALMFPVIMPKLA